MNIRIFIYQLLLVLLISQDTYSITYIHYSANQDQVPLDSVIQHAKMKMYKNPDKVISIADSIYKASANDSPERVRALLLKINGFTAKRDYQKSLDLLLKAQEIVQRTNDIDLQATIINRFAIIYQQLKIYDKALENVDRGNDFIQKNHVKDADFLVANNQLIKGIIYKEQLSCELAINYFNKAIARFGRTDIKKAYPNLSIAEYNKGQCYSSGQNYIMAEQCYKKAVSYARLVNANSLEAFALKGLADVYLKQEKNNMAIDNLLKALELSKDVGDQLLEGTIYHGLAENYLLLGDINKFTQYREFSLNSQNAVKEAERKAISDSINGLSKTQRQNISILNKHFTIFVTIAVSIILITAFFTGRSYVKYKKVLSDKKKKLDSIVSL